MSNFARFAGTFAIVALLLGADREPSKYSEEAARVAQEKREAIRAEIEDLHRNAWAGEYYCGDGLGANEYLSIAPENGYVFEFRGCLGVYDRNYGPVTLKTGNLRLSATFGIQKEGFQALPVELVPVNWESRHYLIRPDEFVDFCNDVNRRYEPRNDVHGSHLLRKGDHTIAVTGFPDVPQEFRKYLLKVPVESTIIDWGFLVTTRSADGSTGKKHRSFIIDAGTSNGLHNGMQLFPVRPDTDYHAFEVLKASDTDSTLILKFGDTGEIPRVGLKLSTLPSWMKREENTATSNK